MKQKFLEECYWTLTYQASSMHNKLYSDRKADAKAIEHFKQELHQFIYKLSEAYITASIDETTHINNIKKVIKFSEKFSSILTNSKLNIGTSQKLLNLYLKHLWCAELIKFPPPHFPIDRQIQKAFKIPVSQIINWTKMDTIIEYKRIIEIGRKIQKTNNIKNLALVELELFNTIYTTK